MATAMSSASLVTVPSFEGHTLNPIHFGGQPVWIITQVEAALGYSKKGLGRLISREWGEEFTEGIHYHSIHGDDLRDLKAVLKLVVSDTTSLKHARAVTLLTQAGLDMVCVKTDKPAGKNLRKWLVEEVLPAIRSTGSYTAPTPANEPSSSPVDTSDPRLMRERRLAAREARLAAKQRADGIDKAVETIKALLPDQVNPTTEAILRIQAARIRTGEKLSMLLPQTAADGGKRAGEIADMFEVHVNSVNAAVRTLKLKGTKHCEERQDLIEIEKDGKKIQKAQTVFLYDAEGVEMIRAKLVERGKLKSDA